MAFRKKLSHRTARKKFRRGTKVKSKNYRGPSARGGYRM